MNKNIISDEARDLIVRLLDKDPKKRLGASGADEIKKHKYFKDINWGDYIVDKTPDELETTKLNIIQEYKNMLSKINYNSNWDFLGNKNS